LFWTEALISSRLLEYEVSNRIHAYGLGGSHGDEARTLFAGMALIEMGGRALARAMEPWPLAIRTLDALHLATMEFVRQQREPVALASYDSRPIAAARALGVPLAAV
jgi:hypothetical protein